MRDQETALAAVLTELGWRVVDNPPARARLDALPLDVRREIVDLYRSLGGLDPLPVRTGPWDMTFEGLIIEYDEEQHFNRYRRITLCSDFARELPWHRAYLDYCSSHEKDCLRKASGGGYWTSPATEKMFGAAGPRKELDGAGSPRWKQRAVYDAIRDATARHGVVRMARVALYDELGGVQLRHALGGLAPLDRDALLNLIRERTVG